MTIKKDKLSIYTVLNMGWTSAFEDEETEITGLDKTFDFEKVIEDQPSRSNICTRLGLFKKIENHLKDEDVKQIITSSFNTYYYSFEMVKMFFTNYNHLIDTKNVLSLLNGYKCYQAEYSTSSYKGALYCEDWSHAFNYDYDKMLDWLYNNHKSFLDDALEYRHATCIINKNL